MENQTTVTTTEHQIGKSLTLYVRLRVNTQRTLWIKK